jgi:apoptosis-inducing factor 3
VERSYTLRSIADANVIDSKLAGSDVVVFGSSFIGMEIAANAVAKAKSVTVIARSDLPFKQSLGDEIGAAFLKLHEKQKVRFVKNGVVKEAHQEGDKVVALTLSTGEKLPVDVIVFGVGVEVKSTTSFISGVKLDRDGSIFCDESLQAADGLYVAGDVARFPDTKKDGHFLRIEHWGVAQNMGNVAGRNMAAGKAVAKFDHVPFFWTMQFGKGLRYCGHSASYDAIIFDKEANGLEADTLKFVAFYVKDGTVVAAASVGRDPIVSKVAEMMQTGKTLTASAVQEAIAAGQLSQLIK